jgi:hypothetical protein
MPVAAHGWQLTRVTTDRGSEFGATEFRETIAKLGGDHVIVPRPQSSCVERVHLTILNECWRPALARHLMPRYTALRHDLESYLRYYNTDRAHTGRNNNGRVPIRSSARPRCGHTDHDQQQESSLHSGTGHTRPPPAGDTGR